MAPKLSKISIGFQGGQVLGLRIAEDQLHELHEALSLGQGGWHELAGEEGSVRLDLSQVVYVRSENEELRVGFGA